MKIRTDFVTNSSSSSYIMSYMDNPNLFRELRRVGILVDENNDLELPSGIKYELKDGGANFIQPAEESYSADYLSYIMQGCSSDEYVCEILMRLKKAGLVQYKSSIENLLSYKEIYQEADLDQQIKIIDKAREECSDIENSVGEILEGIGLHYQILQDYPYAIAYTKKMHQFDSSIIEAEFIYESEFEGECCGNYHYEIKNDIDFPLVETEKKDLKNATEDDKADRKYNLIVLSDKGEELRFANNIFREDKEIVLVAVNSCGTALEWASDELKSDREVVLAAVKNAGGALMDADKCFRNDREIVFEAVKTCGAMLELASDELKADREIVLTAIQTAGLYLYYADKKFLSDKEIVLAAMSSSSHIYKIISEELKKDKDIIIEGLKSDNCTYKDIDESRLNDKDIVIEAVKKKGVVDWWEGYRGPYNYVSDKFKNDIDVIVTTLQHDGNALDAMDETIKNDKEYVLMAVKQNGNAFEFASEELRNNKDFVFKVAKIKANALKYVSSELKKDEDIIKLAKELGIELD